MEASGAPFCDGFFAVHGGLPAYFEALHECFEKFEIDDVVFDDEDVDGGYGAVEHASGKGRVVCVCFLVLFGAVGGAGR